MSSSHSLEQSSRYARAALDRMSALGIPPRPENFSVWYAYFSGALADLNRWIDARIAAGQPFDEDCNRELYTRFIGIDREAEALSAVSRRLHEAIGTVRQLLDTAGRDTSRYGDSLATISDRLDAGTEIQQLRQVVEALAAETRAMVAHNRRLGNELGATSQQMARMQLDLEAIRREALTDGLTGIANRKAFDLMLHEAVTAARENGRPLCLLMVDIDFFKNFNDTHGHRTGDEVLRLVARVLKETIRETDMAARYGGEEFVILLPDATLDNAVAIAERIREKVGTRQVVRRREGESLGRITLSIGAAGLAPGEPAASFIDRADAALYAAKRAGRNRVTADPGLDGRAAPDPGSPPSRA